jgi:hypothetical protein
LLGVDLTRSYFEQLSIRRRRNPDSKSKEDSTLSVKRRLSIEVFLIRFPRVNFLLSQRKRFYTLPHERQFIADRKSIDVRTGLRFFSAVAIGLVLVLTGLMARHLGGGKASTNRGSVGRGAP